MATKKNTYFLRSFLLLVEGGLYITRHILEREKGDDDLGELLKSCENKLRYEFHRKQYIKLFPEYGYTDIYKWDLQLLVGVLITVFGHTISSTEKQKLRALRDLRNEIYMHCSSASLDQWKYEDVREDLEDIITSLASTFDEPVKERCSRFISEFVTGSLDGVKPSSATLNGLSQGCQKQISVGLHAELVVCGPSEYWVNLCERTLDTIFNNADGATSGDSDLKEIEKNVKQMLDFLQANKDVVFKGSKMECVVLRFVCASYDDFLQFVEMFDRQELQVYLDRISEALMGYYNLRSAVHILCKVRAESLQLALYRIIVNGNFKEELVINPLETSSKQGIDEMETLTGYESASDGEVSSIKEMKQSLRMECASREGLLHTLNSFTKEEFSDHLTSVADALSRHVGQKITLKASLKVQEVMEAIEESVVPEIINLTKRISKLYPILIEELYVENITSYLRDRGFLSLSEYEDVRAQRRRSERVETLLKKVLNGPIKMQSEFLTALRLHGYEHLAEVVESSTVTFKDLVVDNEISNLRLRFMKQYPFLEDKVNFRRFASDLRYSVPPSLGYAFPDVTSNKTFEKFLKKVVKGPKEMKKEIKLALERLTMPFEVPKISDAEVLDDREHVKLRLCLVKNYTFLKEELNIEIIADHLRDEGFLSSNDLEEIRSYLKRSKRVDMFLKKVLNGSVEMMKEFMKALTKYGYEYLTEVLEITKVTEADLMVFSEREQLSAMKGRRPSSVKPRIRFSESSRQILEGNLSLSVIEKISDHLLSRLVFSTTEHTDILFPPFALNGQSIFLETLDKCSVDVFEDLCELLNSFGLAHLVRKLDENFQTDEPSQHDFEKSLSLSRGMKLNAELGTAKGSATKLDDSVLEIKVEAYPLKAEELTTKLDDAVSEMKMNTELRTAKESTTTLADSFSEMKLKAEPLKKEGSPIKLDKIFQDKDFEEQK